MKVKDRTSSEILFFVYMDLKLYICTCSMRPYALCADGGKDRLNRPCLFIWRTEMNNELQQEARFGGHSHRTIHYIGVPVGPHALSNSGSSPFSAIPPGRSHEFHD